MDQSKIWIKLLVLKKKKTEFLKTYLKALNIRNKNAWVWNEMFFKTQVLNPNFPKNKIFN